ncbi:hypothetical protein SLEP1_g22827 [Rubroshorea leprosula]|uniref:Uncharacterized protein n=1 Tax=Rubroshorea leprosula TaxID=152421 RepID=A0AAV5JLB4_9ROSI|nr:hypothetical protein SLEP1_g22827 [Rubroshorea leprosula]
MGGACDKQRSRWWIYRRERATQGREGERKGKIVAGWLRSHLQREEKEEAEDLHGEKEETEGREKSKVAWEGKREIRRLWVWLKLDRR